MVVFVQIWFVDNSVVNRSRLSSYQEVGGSIPDSSSLQLKCPLARYWAPNAPDGCYMSVWVCFMISWWLALCREGTFVSVCVNGWRLTCVVKRQRMPVPAPQKLMILPNSCLKQSMSLKWVQTKGAVCIQSICKFISQMILLSDYLTKAYL